MTVPCQISFDRFVGFDVGKTTIAVFDSHCDKRYSLANHPDALAEFLKQAGFGSTTLAVCEATGGYERTLLAALVAAGVAAHRADTPRVKAYIRSLGIRAKTDAIDAKALALYARERASGLALWSAPDAERLQLQALVLRRGELVDLRVAEANRAQAPAAAFMARSFKAIIDAVDTAIAAIEAEIDELLAACQSLRITIDCLQSITGIGHVTAVALAANMPELGHMDRKQAASLAGLAPHARDSGAYSGRRRIHGGRRQVPTLLFMAALAASRKNEQIAPWYKSLIARGKPKMLALTAVMRKLIVIANARLRDKFAEQS